jgi:hypothetical protein
LGNLQGLVFGPGSHGFLHRFCLISAPCFARFSPAFAFPSVPIRLSVVKPVLSLDSRDSMANTACLTPKPAQIPPTIPIPNRYSTGFLACHPETGPISVSFGPRNLRARPKLRPKPAKTGQNRPKPAKTGQTSPWNLSFL